MKPIDLDPGEAILHEGDPERCVVLLPGVRYFSQAPLLWFAREAASAGGWSVLELSERAPAGEEPFEWIATAPSALNGLGGRGRDDRQVTGQRRRPARHQRASPLSGSRRS